MSDNPGDELGILTDGPPDADWVLILAHGAGQGMDSSFMTHIACELGRAGVRVVRFEFPYMAEMRRTGKRKPPNRESVLLERWNLIIDRELAAGTEARRLLIGGKSLGGRMASLIADGAEPWVWSASAIPSTRPESPPGRARSTCGSCVRRRSSARAPATPSANRRRSPEWLSTTALFVPTASEGTRYTLSRLYALRVCSETE